MKKLENLYHWIHRRTVARDLILGVVLVASAVVLTMGSLSYITLVRLAEEELRDRIVRTVNIMTRRLAPIMVEDRFEDAVEFMQQAKHDLPDSYLKLVDENGVLLYPEIDLQLDSPIGTLLFEKPVIHGSVTVGRLCLGMRTDRIAIVKRNMFTLTLTLMGALILALLGTIKVIVQRILHRSLERVQEGIRTIAEGNYDHRIADSPYSDVQVIIREINSMAHFISNRTLQLQREIGERKRTEIALTESRRKLMTLMQNLPGMAYRCENDQNYTMRFVSQGVKALTGYSADQLIDSMELNYNQIIHPGDRDLVRNAVEQGLMSNRAFEIEYRIVTADGAVKWVWEAGIGVVNVFGDVQALEGFIMDIDSRRMAEEELKRLNEELEMRVQARTADLEVTNRALKESLKLIKETQSRLVESEKLAALGGMVAGMAHEINNPLGITVTAASYLDGVLNDIRNRGDAHVLPLPVLDTLQESLRIILVNLRRASELVNGFKLVASDQTQEDRRVFNLKEYLDEILLSLRPTLKKSRVTVSMECPDHITIDSYPGAMYQIMTNLILNALKHAYDPDQSGVIRIQAHQTVRHLLIVFSDDGRGITNDILPRIFDPFFTTKRGQGGSGLGLHIVFNLVTNTLKGEIYCESQPGEGTQFMIRIPYSQLGSGSRATKSSDSE